MTKFKYNISNKNLSWEKIHPKICDKKSCKNLGEFRAPKSRSQLNAYYYFCLNTH